MVKNVVLFIASVLLVPLTMFADQQLELLRKRASASFGYWPYIVVYTAAPLVVTIAAMAVMRLLTLTPRQKAVVGMGYLLLGLFVVFYPMLVILIPAIQHLPPAWLYYRDLTRIIGSVFAVAGLFQIFDGRKASDTRVTHE